MSPGVRIAAILCLLLAYRAVADPGIARMAEGRVARMPVVVGRGASAETREAAQTLAGLLGRMSGAEFAVVEGDGRQGIALGRLEDFPGPAEVLKPLIDQARKADLPVFSDGAGAKPEDREAYVIQSHPDGIFLLGVSELGVRNALWDLASRLGYRQYFPGAIWEIVPQHGVLEFSGEVVGRPSYAMRLFWYSGNTYPERRDALADWKRKNRMDGALEIKAGHSWENLLTQLRPVLEQRPEFLAEVGGQRLWKPAAKFELSNPELRKLLVDTYLERFRSLLARNPEELSFSVDPSDGGGWSESEASRAMGSVSDQVVTLANEVAEAMDKEFPGKRIGMYAYNFHSHPPSKKVHPRIVVLVGTHFRKTNLSLKEQIEGWAKQGATVGVRDIVSYLGQDYDLPSRANGWRKINAYTRSLRNYHAWGARLYSLETTDSWVINGLLNYAIAKTLWDVSQPVDEDQLLAQFVGDCFPGAKQAATEFFALIGRKPQLGPDLFNRLYSSVDAAWKSAASPVEESRIEDLALYVRYLELFHAAESARGDAREAAMAEMFAHLYRSRGRDAFHARGLIVDQTIRDKTVWTGDAATRESLWKQGIPPWASDLPPLSPTEIREVVRAGLAANERLPFDTVPFSSELVPAKDLVPEGQEFPKGKFATAVKASRFFTWTDSEGDVFRLRVHNSQKPYAPRPSLWADAEASLEAVDASHGDKLVGTGEAISYELRSPHRGLHTLIFAGPFSKDDVVELDPSKPWTMTDSPERGVPMLPYMSRDTSTFYFYVPKGTPLLGMFLIGGGTLVLPDGSRRSLKGNSHTSLDVPEGADGKFWRVEDWQGRSLQLLTVPPYFARHPSELLLPREVVEKDRR